MTSLEQPKLTHYAGDIVDTLRKLRSEILFLLFAFQAIQ